MSLTFITVNVKTNVVLNASYHVPFIPDFNAFTTIVDDADTGIKELLNNPSSHLFTDIMTGKPYVSLSYDGSHVNGMLINPSNATIPSQANISVLGKSYSVGIVNSAFAFPIVIHPSVVNQKVSLSVQVDGFPFSSIDIGGSYGHIETQIYQNTNGIVNIIPAKNTDLADYWQNALVDMSYSAVDLATANGIVIHTLFNYVLPALNLNLTDTEKNAISEIQNKLLPSISTNLSNLTDGTNLDIHYNSYKLHTIQSKTAMEKYVADRIEFSKYIQLK